MAHFKKDFLQFFMELAANNNKDWFDVNRGRYEENVREPFKKFVQHIISKIAEKDSSFADLEAKDCIFRINRDIRFSKDKTPYKLNVSAVVASGGKKSKAINGVYFEFSPEHVRAYGGIYEIEKDELYDVREGIANNLNEFKKLYLDPNFKKVFGSILGEKNKVLPNEFKEAAAKEELMFNKQWYFYAEFEPELVLSDTLEETILTCYNAGRPLEAFFNKHIKR